MKCLKCGYETYQGKFCQNCGNEFKIPTYITVLTIVNFLLAWIVGIQCLSMRNMCKIYLKNGDLVNFKKWVDVSKIVCISGTIVAIIINIIYISSKMF